MSDIVNLLNRVIGNRGRQLKKANEYMYWSPFTSHHKPKLQINIQTQKWHCWISNQGGHKLFQLFRKLNANKEQYDELKDIVGESKSLSSFNSKVKKKTLHLPKEFHPLWNGGDSIIKRHALSYIAKRGMSMADIIRYNIGYCSEGLYTNRIIVPSYDSDGNINYFVGRDIYSGGMKYKNPPISKDVIGFDLFINWDEPIVLCEGVFDAMAIKRNAIPLFGKTISNTLKMRIVKRNVKTIYICLDNDAKKQALEACEYFIANGIDVHLVDLPDSDPSDMGFEKIQEMIDNTYKLSQEKLIEEKILCAL